jgi:hypothetical protein
MSLESWKAEYYPVPADQCPPEQAVEHSLRKWIGLRRENLERHGMRAMSEDITDAQTSEWFRIGASTCSLCETHTICRGCPLLAGQCVDGMNAWWDDHDPEPMIAALEAALKMQQSQTQGAR